MKKMLIVPVLIFTIPVAQWFLPWWSVGLVCFIVCYIFNLRISLSFISSLLAAFLVWYVRAMLTDQHFDTPMTEILGSLFGGISRSAVLFLTGITGGVVGGLCGMLGSWTHKIKNPNAVS